MFLHKIIVNSELTINLSFMDFINLTNIVAKFLIFKICKTKFLKFVELDFPLFCDILIRLFLALRLYFPSLDKDIDKDFIFLIFPLCLNSYLYTY